MSEYYDFDTNVNDTNYARSRNESFINTKNGLSKVFLLMFLGLLVTAGVAIGFPYLLASINLPAQTLGTIYLAVVIISAFSLIILSFVTNYVILKSKKGGIGMFMTYAVVMGFFLSFFILAYDFSLIGYAFIVTAGAFGIMALYGIFTKGSTNVLGYIGSGLLGALFMMIGLYFILGIFGIYFETLYWVISIIGIIMMLAFTGYDVSRAKALADRGELENNMVTYFALQIYTDFVYLFIRILSLLARFTNRR